MKLLDRTGLIRFSIKIQAYIYFTYPGNLIMHKKSLQKEVLEGFLSLYKMF